MGAWIEIIVDGIHHHKTHRSHPTWVRGLKYIYKEMLFLLSGRTPHGCVDYKVII